ncbi:hypothetical protein K488DRAFT_85989 [Vararia minispora EC-137]|uniref:Uncharacterized protein n=1 Tax=Vararia minispora EC-137 TaxID=1314806 RepID=A0ACB8QKX0_9AGAM|nr:hypothetical protein K488DRAFT_85989 [Vararia minispora EC-137]
MAKVPAVWLTMVQAAFLTSNPHTASFAQSNFAGFRDEQTTAFPGSVAAFTVPSAMSLDLPHGQESFSHYLDEAHKALRSGFIAWSFPAPSAERYFFLLLKTSIWSAHPFSLVGDDQLLAFYAFPSGHSNGDSPLLIDRQYLPPSDRHDGHWPGFVIEQEMWQPTRQCHRASHVDNATLQQPMWFMTVRGVLGIPLSTTVRGRPTDVRYALHGAGDAVNMGTAVTAFIRVQIKMGSRQAAASRQVRLTNARGVRITNAKLVKQVALAVKQTLEEAAQNNQDLGDLRLDRIVLIGLMNVSRGSWQPLLLLAEDPDNHL